ncbi:MAG: hypothetical protein U0R17_04695 [Acidimicrobiia bacterium]
MAAPNIPAGSGREFALTIADGVEDHFLDLMRAFALEGLPFSDEYGGLDFTGRNVLPIVNVEVVHGADFLACRKVSKVNGFSGLYNNIAGHVQGDGTEHSVVETILEELLSESSIIPGAGDTLFVGHPFVFHTRDGRTLHCAPARLILGGDEQPPIVLNEEHDHHCWVPWSQYQRMQRVPLVDEIHRKIEAFLGPTRSL